MQINDFRAAYGQGRGMQAVPSGAALARPVPRYTSYPPATHFSSAIGADAYGAWLAAIPADATLSLYLHVPYCARLCWYCACHTRVAGRYERVARFAAALPAEIAAVRARIPAAPRVTHVHWGGGTPTVLRPDDFARIHRALTDAFALDAGTEIAVEIDPRSLSDAMVAALAAAGVRRVSFGVQDFDPGVQAAINRIQPFAVTRAAVDKLRAAGVGSVNLDLVYGLPLQTVASLERTIRLALGLLPDRIALFGYAHVPWMKRHQRLIRAADLPGPEARWAQAQAAAAMIVDAGYAPIGIDHFARPDDALAKAAAAGRLRRNFQGYTADDATHLLGFGPSAISVLPQGYAQNAADIAVWLAAAEAGRLATARGIALDGDDRLRRDAIERVMCDLAVDLDAVARRHGRSAADLADALPALDALVRQGIVAPEGSVVRVRPEARALARLAAAAFDRHLAAGRGRHSVAV